MSREKRMLRNEGNSGKMSIMAGVVMFLVIILIAAILLVFYGDRITEEISGITTDYSQLLESSLTVS